MGAFHGIYKTGNQFKSNRQLIHDLMIASFLNNHVGLAVYNKGLELMRLFDMKMKLAAGRPFDVKKAFEYASLDFMLEFAFGKNWVDTAPGQQVDNVSKLGVSDVKLDPLDQPVRFPLSPIANFLKSVDETPEIVEKTINALMPKMQTWWWSKQSWYKKVFDDKEHAMKEQVVIGVKNIRAGHIETGVERMLSVLMTQSGARPRGEPSSTPHGMRPRTFHSLIPSVGLCARTTARVCWQTKRTSMERQGRS